MSKVKAIGLCRISSEDQAKGHSLDSQLESIKARADEMELDLVRVWSGVRTSKSGKNFGRADLEEMLTFCKKNNIKYLLVDMVNRLMREVKVLVYYIVRFEEIGVKVHFCDPGQAHLNNNDSISNLMLLVEGFKAESDNKTRRDTTVARMKSRYRDGYYLSHPHQGYIKSNVPGLHKPDSERFFMLQKACHLIIYDGNTPEKAIRWLNETGYRTRGGNKLDLNHFIEFISDRYYCGFIDIKSDDWPKNIRGLHEPMLSVREHKLLLAIIKKRNPRKRIKHNPEFPMANILRHLECASQGGYEKFAGVNHKRGKRPSGSVRPIKPVYDCRDCRRRIPRDITHQNITQHFSKLEFFPSREAFKKALIKTWKLNKGSQVDRQRTLVTNRNLVNRKILDTTEAYVAEQNNTVKSTLKTLLDDYSIELQQLESDLLLVQNTELESEDFVNFALDFILNVKDNWWKLSYENKKRGEQILFNGKIYADTNATVHTPQISTIFRLAPIKKAPEYTSDAHLVELAGNAPASNG